MLKKVLKVEECDARMLIDILMLITKKILQSNYQNKITEY